MHDHRRTRSASGCGVHLVGRCTDPWTARSPGKPSERDRAAKLTKGRRRIYSGDLPGCVDTMLILDHHVVGRAGKVDVRSMEPWHLQHRDDGQVDSAVNVVIRPTTAIFDAQ